MPLAPIPTPSSCPMLVFGAATASYSMPGDSSPLIVAVDIPDGNWFEKTMPALFGTRRNITVKTNFSSQTGVYGVNTGESTVPVLDGIHGKVAGPGIGQWGTNYKIARVLPYAARCYIVVRSQSSTPGGSVSISIT